MNKRFQKITRLNILVISIVSLGVTAVLSIIPFDLMPPYQTGGTIMAYGVPFRVYNFSQGSYPGAVADTQLHPEAIIANLLVTFAAVLLVFYLYRVMKSRRVQSK